MAAAPHRAATRVHGDTPGVTPVKPIDGFGTRWDALVARVPSWDKPPPLPMGERRIAVVGGGAGGVELALAAHHRLSTEHPHHARRAGGRAAAHVSLYTRSALLPSHTPGIRVLCETAMRECGAAQSLPPVVAAAAPASALPQRAARPAA
eukprot:gene29059-64270_t